MALPKLRLPRRSRPALPPPEPVEAASEGEGARMGFFEHLEELRDRLFRAVLALVIGTAIGIAVATPILEFLIAPYGNRLQTLGPTEGVVAYFRVALMVGGALAIPMITYQLLAFILPALTRKETRILLLSIFPVTLLFIVGVCFAWFILVPPAFNFLQGFQTDVFKPEWTASEYLGFVTALLFWMGVAFETPLVFFLLSILGTVTARTLIRNWRIAIVASAVAAAVITPTIDPVNMALVMGPLLALYVLSILLVYVGARYNRAEA